MPFPHVDPLTHRGEPIVIAAAVALTYARGERRQVRGERREARGERGERREATVCDMGYGVVILHCNMVWFERDESELGIHSIIPCMCAEHVLLLLLLLLPLPLPQYTPHALLAPTWGVTAGPAALHSTARLAEQPTDRSK